MDTPIELSCSDRLICPNAAYGTFYTAGGDAARSQGSVLGDTEVLIFGRKIVICFASRLLGIQCEDRITIY